jgi:16S rRNA (adenine1518-N6/adenine1519-N6)-dimethyltransferase
VSGGERAPEGHRPRRSLGQNFLVDRGFQARIVDAVPIPAGGTVLEIGPGRGALTEGLAARVAEAGARLVLVELDDALAEAQAARWRDRPDIEVLHQDVLTLEPGQVTADPGQLVVVGNIPYNITTPILFHLLERPRPASIVLMVQREVADRILADAGTGGYGALTVGVRSVASVRRLLAVPAGAFRPRPKVDSAVICIEPRDPPPLSAAEEAALRRLTRAVFQWRRKQLGKTLRDHPELRIDPERAAAALASVGAEPRTRPEALDPDRFMALSRALSGALGAGGPDAR